MAFTAKYRWSLQSACWGRRFYFHYMAFTAKCRWSLQCALQSMAPAAVTLQTSHFAKTLSWYQLLTYLFTYLLTYSMQQSPSWEANWFSASQEIPRILWKPKVHYRIQIVHQLSLSWASSIQSIPSHHLLKIQLNIIIPSTPGSSKWSLSFRLPHQNSLYASPISHTRYMHHPSHSSQFILQCT